MNPDSQTKKGTVAARFFSVLVSVLGVYALIGAVVVPIFRRGASSGSPLDIPVANLVFSGVLASFSFYCFFAAYRLWTEVCSDNARRISFVIAVALVVFVLQRLPVWRYSNTLMQFSIPLMMVPAGIFHVFFNKVVQRWVGLPVTIDWSEREKSAKRYFGWLAVFSFLAVRSFFKESLPKDGQLGTLIGIVCSILLALAIYKVGVAIALRNKPKDADIRTGMPPTQDTGAPADA